jgi:hypothetical protein
MRHVFSSGKHVRNALILFVTLSLLASVFVFGAGLTPATTTNLGAASNPQAHPHAAAAATYDVNFTEVGLVGVAPWAVTFNNSTTTGTGGSQIQFAVANGTYAFTIGAIAGYAPTPGSGSIKVAGANQSVLVSFVQQHQITFTETGLPTNTAWAVYVQELAGSTGANSPSNVVVHPLNNTFNGTATYGNYTYSIMAVPGYDVQLIAPVPTSICGSSPAGTNWCNVTEANATVAITFHLSPQYTLQFNQSGLSAGTNWSVTFNGMTVVSATATITFGTVNGTYAFSIGGGGTATGTNHSTPSSGMITVVGTTYQNVTFWPFSPISITTTFTSNFTTNGLRYISLPFNVTWNVSIVNATLGKGFTQVINVSFVNSVACPLFFPCLPVYQDVVNPGWVTHSTATSGSYYYPLTLANLTAQKFLGFSLPQGTWIISIWDNYDDLAGGGNTSNFEVDASAGIIATPPAASVSQPTSGQNVTAGSTVIAGNFSGYFVVSANVTVYNASGATVLTVPIYAPGPQNHPFAVTWPALTPGAYKIVVALGASWEQVYTFSSTVNIVAGVPVTYFNQSTPSLIPGLGNGGSAAVLIAIGAIVGMIVMMLVGRGTWGGPKATPAQPWSSQPAQPSGATDSGGGTTDTGSGSQGQSPPT